MLTRSGTAMDILAKRYRIAFDKINGGREQWIEGTLELALVLRDGRANWPDHRAFSRWLERYGLQEISPQDRSALNQFADDLVYARQLLKQSQSISWQQIWRERPNKPQRTPSESRKGALRTDRGPRRTGHGQRNRIPDVMRDDLPPRKRVSDLVLTPEQVDPDFKGTPLEFTTKYGHVNLHTKAEIKHHKQQDALNAWLGTVGTFERNGRTMLEALAAVDPTVLQEWKSKPGKIKKLQDWCKNAQFACDSLKEILKDQG